ncbi:hypothetical protein G114_14741 [Aeromonas diversa CDC 2478-85]|uniref:Uncharacterized protein n=1 Tax=Aeromonas diversa CDC 2478-85 TaxID=1268237 RepID=N9TYK1_9GAMM|nr:hypothetical protein G114_14741 [Aeromonas diversa CDC 2478-85]
MTLILRITGLRTRGLLSKEKFKKQIKVILLTMSIKNQLVMFLLALFDDLRNGLRTHRNCTFLHWLWRMSHMA